MRATSDEARMGKIDEKEKKRFTPVLRLFLGHEAERQLQIQASYKDAKEDGRDYVTKVRGDVPE
jgi:hypothetical protein